MNTITDNGLLDSNSPADPDANIEMVDTVDVNLTAESIGANQSDNPNPAINPNSANDMIAAVDANNMNATYTGSAYAPRCKVKLIYHDGDVFSRARPGTLFIHSCNTKGVWGAGIARQLKERFPKCYYDYKDECAFYAGCKDYEPLGTATLSLDDSLDDGDVKSESKGVWNCFVGSLLVRERYGTVTQAERDAGYEATVTQNTKKAMEQLFAKIKIEKNFWQRTTRRDFGMSKVRMPKINSGLFGIPWEVTEKMLMELEAPDGMPELQEIHVYVGETSPSHGSGSGNNASNNNGDE